MYRRTTRGNRIGLSLTGLSLLLIGAAIVILNRDLFGTNASDTKLYPTQVSIWISEHRWALWVLVAIVLAIALMALRWILMQFRTDSLSRLQMDTESDDDLSRGRTAASASAICAAVADEAEAIHGVRDAYAAVSGSVDGPELWLTVTAASNADTGTIRQELLETVIANARTALESPTMVCYLRLKVSKHAVSNRFSNLQNGSLPNRILPD